MRVASRVKIALRQALGRAGFDLVRSLSPGSLLRQRMDLVRRHRIDVLFDVGANAGQYASTMRALGYEGRIVSFEPGSEAFRILSDAALRDPGWTAVNCALGHEAGQTTLHVSANSQSSSVLPMLPSHLTADRASQYVVDEMVEVTTLDEQIALHVPEESQLFVKIDTQGTELEVLAGAGEALERIQGLQLELSLVPLYGGQPLIEETLRRVRSMGFVPMALEPDFFDPETGALLQADCILFRSDSPRA